MGKTAVKMVAAKKHVPIVKKRTKRFERHQSDRFMRVDPSPLLAQAQGYRQPRSPSVPWYRAHALEFERQIGYGSNKKTKYMMPSGHKAFLVNNVSDVELLLMHNRTFAAEIAHGVSSRKRIDIISRAKQLGVKVTNPKAKVTTEV
ncbi:60S ribosomal protein L32 like [Verticillium longisporum]|uniref:60S ribosomal protein L32 like n=1 Tax=Verticillium longisporum TaxID=100787 RepID=A0A8I3A059_VERLO|nr:60S ribosomal protein L32 like [Verticillium longisporum]